MTSKKKKQGSSDYKAFLPVYFDTFEDIVISFFKIEVLLLGLAEYFLAPDLRSRLYAFRLAVFYVILALPYLKLPYLNRALEDKPYIIWFMLPWISEIILRIFLHLGLMERYVDLLSIVPHSVAGFGVTLFLLNLFRKMELKNYMEKAFFAMIFLIALWEAFELMIGLETTINLDTYRDATLGLIFSAIALIKYK